MSFHAGSLQVVCPRCGEQSTAFVMHRTSDGNLSYSISFHCPHCNERMDSDSTELPASLRTAMVRRDGEFELQWVECPNRTPELLRAVAAIAHVSSSEASRIAKTPNAVLLRGLQLEVDYAASQLRGLGALVRVIQVKRQIEG